jgi:membrane peptidoglycan carboxypeptidase
VETVTDRSGAVVFRADDGGHQVVPQRVADDATYALEQVVQSGTGTGAQLTGGRAAAGKTGTTEGNLSALFCGYTPQLATVVAMFRPGNLPLQNILGYSEVTGGTLPATLWSNFMNTALDGQPLLPFPDPPDPTRPVYTSYPGNPDTVATPTQAFLPPVPPSTPQSVLPTLPAAPSVAPSRTQGQTGTPSSPSPSATRSRPTAQGTGTGTPGGLPAGAGGGGGGPGAGGAGGGSPAAR